MSIRETYSAPKDFPAPKTKKFRAMRDFLISACRYSRKQANWLTRVLEEYGAYDPQFCAYLTAMATRFGPDMQDFEASDGDLEAEAQSIFERGMLAAWDPSGGPQ